MDTAGTQCVVKLKLLRFLQEGVAKQRDNFSASQNIQCEALTARACTSEYPCNLNGNLSFATINVLTSDFMEKSLNTRVLAIVHGILNARGVL